MNVIEFKELSMTLLRKVVSTFRHHALSERPQRRVETSRRAVKDALNRLHLAHVRQEVAQEILDAVTQGRRRRRATRAGAFHGEVDDAVPEAPEGDVATVAGDRRAD